MHHPGLAILLSCHPGSTVEGPTSPGAGMLEGLGLYLLKLVFSSYTSMLLIYKLAGRQIWVVEGLRHLGDLMFHQKLCMRHDA